MRFSLNIFSLRLGTMSLFTFPKTLLGCNWSKNLPPKNGLYKLYEYNPWKKWLIRFIFVIEKINLISPWQGCLRHRCRQISVTLTYDEINLCLFFFRHWKSLWLYGILGPFFTFKLNWESSNFLKTFSHLETFSSTH